MAWSGHGMYSVEHCLGWAFSVFGVALSVYGLRWASAVKGMD
jgi:hypothetical protein